MGTSVESIKELRRVTCAGFSDCRAALEEAGGDLKRAVELLRKRGLEIAAEKQNRQAKAGRIEAYVHFDNKLGALLEVNCETDFVARSDDFCQFTKDIAMQIAASNPIYIKIEDVPKDDLKDLKDKELFYKAHCLLEQVFVKDPSITVKDYLGGLVAKLGENIIIRKFVRLKIGE